MKLLKTVAAGFTASDMRRATDEDPATSEDRDVSGALLRLAETMGGLNPRPPVSPVIIVGLTRMAEFAILCLAGAAALLWAGATDRTVLVAWFVTVTTLASVAIGAFQTLHLFSIGAIRRPRRTLGLMILVLLCLLLCAYATMALFGSERVSAAKGLAIWLALGGAGLVIVRTCLFFKIRSLTRQGRLERRTAIVGGGPAGEELLEALKAQPESDLRIYGVFDDRNDARSPLIVAGYPKLGSVSDLVTFARKTRVDLVIFTMPITAEERLLAMLRKLWVLPIDIRLAAHRNKLRFRPRSYSYIGDVPVLDVFDKPIADWDVVVKAIFDRVVGVLALIILAPVLLLTALAVKLDSKGPVLFKQKRHGFNNEIVEVYKFRSMFADQLDPTAAKAVTKNDPRVTRVGRFIRKTSLDELPQLFNVVFKGNLSLVGPRPHAVHAHLANRAYDQVVEGYFARHRVKPGITGWAQVKGWRGETDTPEKIQKRVEHDLAYIENWSILFDVYILLVTPFALTRTENAY